VSGVRRRHPADLLQTAFLSAKPSLAFALLATPGCCGLPVREPGPIRKILTHLGEPLEPPPHARSRQSPEAAALGETPRRHKKNTTSGGGAADSGSRLPGRGSLGRREQPAHEPLIRRAMIAEVPLTGLSFGQRLFELPGYAQRHGPAPHVSLVELALHEQDVLDVEQIPRPSGQ